MPRYIRAQVPGGQFFFTVTLLERKRRLLAEHVHAPRAAFIDVRHKHPLTIDAIVVLPDHLHCIWTLPQGDADFSTRWRLIKTQFSRQIPAQERLSQRRQDKQERGIWHRRFWEHTVRSEEEFAALVDYIHYNPVKHGHVQQVKDWPYSSFHRYVREGRLPIDWGHSEDAAKHQEAMPIHHRFHGEP